MDTSMISILAVGSFSLARKVIPWGDNPVVSGNYAAFGYSKEKGYQFGSLIE